MPASPPPTSADKRRSPRQRRLRRARCVLANGASTLDVTLRDLSAEGARLTGDGLIALPAAFELRILDDLGGHTVRHVRLVWMRGESAGVEFVG